MTVLHAVFVLRSWESFISEKSGWIFCYWTNTTNYTSSFPVGGLVTDVSEHFTLFFFPLSNASSYLSFFPTVSHSAVFSQTAENAYWNLWKSLGSRKSPARNMIHLSVKSRPSWYTVLICYPTDFHFKKNRM